MITRKYSAGIVSESFWFIEFKEYLKRIKNNMPIEEIKKEIVDNNLFGLPNENRAKRTFGYLKNRVSTLDKEAVKLFFDADLPTQKLINFITIMRNSRIFFEFINEVYREKIRLGEEYMERSDANIFFRNKEIQSNEVANWTDVTKKHISNTFNTLMVEANLLTVRDKKKYINPPVLDLELEKYLDHNGEIDIVKALTGVYWYEFIKWKT